MGGGEALFRKRPLTIIEFTTVNVEKAVIAHRFNDIHHYKIAIFTEYGEKDTLSFCALNEHDAQDEATVLALEGRFGLRGVRCIEMWVMGVKD